MIRTWNKTFKVKDILSDKEDRDTVIAAATEVIRRLKAEQPFSDWTEDAVRPFTDARDSGNVDAFNDAMDALYDRADEDRVWIA